jgi:hypothetical protein
MLNLHTQQGYEKFSKNMRVTLKFLVPHGGHLTTATVITQKIFGPSVKKSPRDMFTPDTDAQKNSHHGICSPLKQMPKNNHHGISSPLKQMSKK